MSTEEFVPLRNLAAINELCTSGADEAPERVIFGLALALASEPSKLLQLREMLEQLQEQKAFPEHFSTWASERIDERVLAMALEYAHDAEVLLQILSFKCGSFTSLLQDIEDLYQHEQICLRVYVKAKLLLRAIPS